MDWNKLPPLKCDVCGQPAVGVSSSTLVDLLPLIHAGNNRDD